MIKYTINISKVIVFSTSLINISRVKYANNTLISTKINALRLIGFNILFLSYTINSNTVTIVNAQIIIILFVIVVKLNSTTINATILAVSMYSKTLSSSSITSQYFSFISLISNPCSFSLFFSFFYLFCFYF